MTSKRRKNNTQLSDLEVALSLLDHVPRTMRLIRAQFRSQQSSAMTLPQMRMLAKLRRGARTNTELAEIIGVSLPAITRMVNTLASRGLVERRPSREDRRIVHIVCTDKGLSAYMAIRQKVQKRLAVFCEKLSESDRRVLVEGMKILDQLPEASG